MVVGLACGPEHEEAVRCVERVGGGGRVGLDFVVAPAAVVALLVLPVGAERRGRVEGGLPVDLGRERLRRSLLAGVCAVGDRWWRY